MVDPLDGEVKAVRAEEVRDDLRERGEKVNMAEPVGRERKKGSGK